MTLRSLHEDSIVIDLHTDSLIQARAVGYRLEARHHNPILERLGFYHADLPRLREGGVTGQFFGVVTFPVRGLVQHGANVEIAGVWSGASLGLGLNL